MTKMEHATHFPETAKILDRFNKSREAKRESARLARTREGRILLGKITAQAIREREAANRAKRIAA
jgi:hypothetical protein